MWVGGRDARAYPAEVGKSVVVVFSTDRPRRHRVAKVMQVVWMHRNEALLRLQARAEETVTSDAIDPLLERSHL